LSQKIANTRKEYIEATGADMVTTECPFCTIQLNDMMKESPSGMKVRYIPDLLAESYRKGDAYA
jgi:Fe-S oxidoreductase